MPTSESTQRALSLIESDKSKILNLSIGSHTNIQPGAHVPKGDARDAPQLAFEVPNAASSYLVACLDLDAPAPSFPFLGPVLHWIQSGLRVENGQLKSSDPVIAKYAGPGPPPGSSPHKYVFLLYEEPEGFDLKKYAPADGQSVGVMQRMRFDWDAWEKKAQLGQVVAVNYFVSN